jgi:carbonic anhydrase
MSIIDNIRRRQSAAAVTAVHQQPPIHKPEMLYFGCVDARLDPIHDIGIEKGKALIFRNIGAVVLKDQHPSDLFDHEAMLQTGLIPPNVTMGAVLEFFLHHIKLDEGVVKHIVVSAHTDCGGLKACRYGVSAENDHYLSLYLESLRDVRRRVMAQAEIQGWDDAQVLRALEQESVRESVANLRSYPAVRSAIANGGLEVHGWIIDTGAHRIMEMHPETLEFEPMGAAEARELRRVADARSHEQRRADEDREREERRRADAKAREQRRS